MGGTTYETHGVIDWLPVLAERALARLRPRLAWGEGRYASFDAWRREARAKVMECLLPPPPEAPFDAVVLAERGMGTHTSWKAVLTVTGVADVQ